MDIKIKFYTVLLSAFFVGHSAMADERKASDAAMTDGLSKLAQEVKRIPDSYPVLRVERKADVLKFKLIWIGGPLTDPKEIENTLSRHAKTESKTLPPLIVDLQSSKDVSADDIVAALEMIYRSGVRYVLFNQFILDVREIKERS